MTAIYRGIIAVADRFVPAKLAPFWNHPAGFITILIGMLGLMTKIGRILQKWGNLAGPKTIFFWAPSFKWGLVIAGIADIARPPEKLSATQSTALAATGFLWARWSLIIIPRIWPYFVCNIFVGCTGLFQMARIYKYYLGSTPDSIIWARYSTVIVPKNWNLFTVNIFVGATGLYQLSRIYNYRKSLPAPEPAPEK